MKAESFVRICKKVIEQNVTKHDTHRDRIKEVDSNIEKQIAKLKQIEQVRKITCRANLDVKKSIVINQKLLKNTRQRLRMY